jgi:hypothetical protein
MNNARKHNSPIIKNIMVEMDNDPWYVKLKRWFNLKMWLYKCISRKYWDKTYRHYIFKSKKDREDDEKRLYRSIETAIIRWNSHGNRTAGSLTREIMKIIK